MKEQATQFGIALDEDDYEKAKSLIHPKCQYIIGSDVLVGPEAIAGSYEQNMIAGRKKMDQLVWGKSRIEVITDQTFYVHFTDYLTHKGQAYTHRCKQKVTIGEDALIIEIEHIHDQEEQDRLNAFYREVGIPLTS